MRDERIEITDEEQEYGATGTFRSLHDVHIPMLSKFPHGLCLMWKECRREAEQPFMPSERRRVIGHRDTSE
jgi:hypothetical protein